MIEPALTADEWARGPGVFGWDDGSVFIAYRDEQPSVERPHAVAAVLLHGQPFGFRPEQVHWLRLMARAEIARGYLASAGFATDIADIINALLPSETKTT